ncbi:MAG: YolD-like family protein [Bacilli bacterium]|nr:YolD-like family protein [Bacilli bacterium]
MNSHRGMKKWMPFASLPEHQIYIDKMLEKRRRTAKPELSQNQKDEINQVLSRLNPGDSVIVFYYDNGHIYQIEDLFCQIDSNQRRMNLKNHQINFDDLLELEINFSSGDEVHRDVFDSELHSIHWPQQ